MIKSKLLKVEIEVKKRTVHDRAELKVDIRTRRLQIIGARRQYFGEYMTSTNTYSGNASQGLPHF